MDYYEWFILVFLSTWFLLTLIFHFPLSGNFRLRSKDLFGVIPDWRFFCPTPIKENYFILYRDISSPDEMTPWKELNLVYHRSASNFIWNPGRRYRKSFLDVCIELIGLSVPNKEKENIIVGSISYVAILHHVSTISRESTVKFTQFALMTRSSIMKTADTELVLLSKIHLLRQEDDSIGID